MLVLKRASKTNLLQWSLSLWSLWSSPWLSSWLSLWSSSNCFQRCEQDCPFAMKPFQQFMKRWHKTELDEDDKRLNQWSGVMVRVSWWGCHVHWENWFQVSRAGRRGEAAVPASDGKKNHLACPICRSLSSCFLVHWFIGQIWQNMILLFNDYNYQMKMIQMIFLLQGVLPPGHDGCSHQNTCVATLDQNLKYLKKEMTHQHWTFWTNKGFNEIIVKLFSHLYTHS